jgi:cytochrome b
MGDKDLSRQDKLVVALVIALVLSLGWGYWLPLPARLSNGRTTAGALTRPSFSRTVPEFDL